MLELYIGLAVVFIIVVLGGIRLAQGMPKPAVSQADQKRARIEQRLTLYEFSIDTDLHPIRYFTNGHPYVWVEITREEVVRRLMLYRKPREHPFHEQCFLEDFSFKVDVFKGCIFVVEKKHLISTIPHWFSMRIM